MLHAEEEKKLIANLTTTKRSRFRTTEFGEGRNEETKKFSDAKSHFATSAFSSDF